MSQSRGREARQQQGGAARAQQKGGAVGEETWAERAAKRSRPGGVDSEGFRVPGRLERKAVFKGDSTVDLTELGGSLVAPLQRYVGGTDLSTTKKRWSSCSSSVQQAWRAARSCRSSPWRS